MARRTWRAPCRSIFRQRRIAERELALDRRAGGSVEVAGELGPLEQLAAGAMSRNSFRSTKW
jgi:hypothetical protein